MNDSGNNSSRCRIVVDAMGGDFAPANAVLGAIEALMRIKALNFFLSVKRKKLLKF